MKINFPFIEQDKFATKNGNFYERTANGWMRVELYLPTSPHTYGFETLEECALSFLSDLNSGKRKNKRGITSGGRFDTTVRKHL